MYKFLIFNLLICYNAFAVDFLHHFPEKNRVTSSIKALLDNHAQEIQEAFTADLCEKGCLKKNKVYEFPWLTGYLIKKGTPRLLGAEILSSVIKQNDLNLLGVPDKKIYLPTQPYEAENSLVIVQKLIPDLDPKPLNLRQVQQLWTLINKSGFVDLHDENYLRLPNDKIMIIDTELYFFSSDLNRGLSRFILSHEFKMFEEDAFKFLLEEFAQFLKQNPESEKCHPTQQIMHQIDFIPYLSETSTYPKIYDAMKIWITVQENIFEWDYLNYFEENYPKPKCS